MPKTTTTKKSAKEKKDFAKLELDDQVNLIHEALQEQVYEALEMDGGGMELMDLEVPKDPKKPIILYISYYGACGNCHISTGGTLDFITHTLKEKVDPRIDVAVV